MHSFIDQTRLDDAADLARQHEASSAALRQQLDDKRPDLSRDLEMALAHSEVSLLSARWWDDYHQSLQCEINRLQSQVSLPLAAREALPSPAPAAPAIDASELESLRSQLAQLQEKQIHADAVWRSIGRIGLTSHQQRQRDQDEILKLQSECSKVSLLCSFLSDAHAAARH